MVERYHTAMEQRLPKGDYDRKNPIIDSDVVAGISNKFGYFSDSLRDLLKGDK